MAGFRASTLRDMPRILLAAFSWTSFLNSNRLVCIAGVSTFSTLLAYRVTCIKFFWLLVA